MPIYEYQCEECERVTEALQKLNDPPLTECSHCGGKLRKLFSAPSFQFKGSGWYVTDYARKSGGESGAKESSEKGSADKGSGGKEESAAKDTSTASSATPSSSGGDGAAGKPAAKGGTAKDS